MLKRILNSINPVEVIKVLKKSDKAAATKGVLKMGGSGVLIPSGAGLIMDGASNENWYEIVSGSIMLIVGSFLAVSLATKVNEIQEGNDAE